jgi:hypothetical protein
MLLILQKKEGKKEMQSNYSDWISRFLINHNSDVQGLCLEATHSMQKQFPELKIVRGHVRLWDKYDEKIYKYPHWWLETVDKEIIDPTEKQFPNLLEYEEWDESLTEPTGKCLNCGEYCFNYKQFCCEPCEKSYIQYLNTGVL